MVQKGIVVKGANKFIGTRYCVDMYRTDRTTSKVEKYLTAFQT